MPIEQKFGSCVFGGFKKDDVLKYINKLLEEHEEGIEKIKKDNESFNENLRKELDEKKISCVQYEEKIENLENVINTYEEKIDVIVAEKDEEIKKQKDENVLLQQRIKELELKLEDFKTSDCKNDVKRAEYIAREKVNQIIRKGKARISIEYKEHVDELKKQRENLRKDASEEAFKILNNAAVRVFNYNSEAKKEVKKFIEKEEQKARDIVDSAKIIADRILKLSAKKALKQISDFESKEVQICDRFDVKKLNEEVSEEVVSAMEKLKGINIFGDEEKDFSGGLKKRRRSPFESFRRKNKEE